MKKAVGITMLVIAGLCIPPLGMSLLMFLGVALVVHLIDKHARYSGAKR